MFSSAKVVPAGASGTTAWNGTRFTAGSGINIVPIGFQQYRAYSIAAYDAMMTAGRMTTLVNAGFDHVRLTVDPAPILASTDSTTLAAAKAVVSHAVDALLGYGLKVIVDSHVETPGNGLDSQPLIWTDTAIESDYPAGTKWQRYLVGIQEIAKLCGTYSNSLVAFEVFNENIENTGSSAWQDRAVAIVQAVRSVNLQTTLLVGGSFYSGFDGLADMHASAFPDTNIGFVIHNYFPRAMTHQGAASDVGDIHGLYYPPIASDQSAAVSAMTTAAGTSGGNSGAQTTTLNAYFTTPQDDTAMAAQLDLIETWRSSNSVAASRIFITEYGTHGPFPSSSPGGPFISRAAWTQDAERLHSARGYSRSMWDFCGDSNEYWQITNQSTNWTIYDEFLVALRKNAGTAFEAEATALFARMTLQPTAARKALINVTIKMLKAAGIWTLFDAFYALAATNIQHASLNWKGNTANLTVVGAPIFAADGGYTGTGGAANANGLTSPMILGNTTTWAQNSGHIAIYKGNDGGVDQIAFGNAVYDTGIGASAASTLSGIVDSGGLNYSTKPSPTSIGHLMVSRTGSAGTTTYYKGSILGTQTVASQAPTPDGWNTMSILAATGQTSQVKIAHVGGGLTASQARDVATICRFYVYGL